MQKKVCVAYSPKNKHTLWIYSNCTAALRMLHMCRLCKVSLSFAYSWIILKYFCVIARVTNERPALAASSILYDSRSAFTHMHKYAHMCTFSRIQSVHVCTFVVCSARNFVIAIPQFVRNIRSFVCASCGVRSNLQKISILPLECYESAQSSIIISLSLSFAPLATYKFFLLFYFFCVSHIRERWSWLRRRSSRTTSCTKVIFSLIAQSQKMTKPVSLLPSFFYTHILDRVSRSPISRNKKLHFGQRDP